MASGNILRNRKVPIIADYLISRRIIKSIVKQVHITHCRKSFKTSWIALVDAPRNRDQKEAEPQLTVLSLSLLLSPSCVIHFVPFCNTKVEESGKWASRLLLLLFCQWYSIPFHSTISLLFPIFLGHRSHHSPLLTLPSSGRRGTSWLQ